MVSDSHPVTLSDRWAGLGRGQSVVLDSIELWTVDLPFRGPVRTARGVHRTRPVLLVHLTGHTLDTANSAATTVEGWGECAALADPTFDPEDVERSLAVLRHLLVPALLDRTGRPGATGTASHLLPPPSELEGLRPTSPHAPLAFSALEMAVADTHLRAEGRSLAGLLGVEGRRVEIGAVVGQADSGSGLLDAVGALVDEGYRRIKLKIGPHQDLGPVSLISSAFPDLLLQVDANGSYTPGEDVELRGVVDPTEATGAADPTEAAGQGGPAVAGASSEAPDYPDLTGRTDVPELMALDSFGLLCIEQPFERSELDAHAHLASRMTTPICLDESLDSPGAVDRALALRACSVVCVKPSRLGGLGAALTVIDRCTRVGVPVWMGGMFESGYARGVLTVLGALDGMAWPGDLSPARTYLEDDLVPEVRTTRDGPGGPLVVGLPGGPGMGPPPEPAALARLGTSHQVIGGSRA